MGSVVVGIYGVTMVILLVNMLIAMMGNTYDAVMDEALGHWALSFTQAIVYFEKTVWVPPLNLAHEAIALVFYFTDKVTLGNFRKITTLGKAEDEEEVVVSQDVLSHITRTYDEDDDFQDDDADSNVDDDNNDEDNNDESAKKQERVGRSSAKKSPKKEKEPIKSKDSSKEEIDDDEEKEVDIESSQNKYDTVKPSPRHSSHRGSRHREPPKAPTNYRFTRALTNPLWED